MSLIIGPNGLTFEIDDVIASGMVGGGDDYRYASDQPAGDAPEGDAPARKRAARKSQ